MAAESEGVLVIGAGGLATDVADMLREVPGIDSKTGGLWLSWRQSEKLPALWTL